MGQGFLTDYIFVSFSSHDVLKIANLSSMDLLENLRDDLLPLWPQGIANENEISSGSEWVVRFLGGDVWSAGGTHGIM